MKSRTSSSPIPSICALSVATFMAIPVLANDWPQWRGPDRADHSPETGLLKSWPVGGPKQVWIYENAGQGYSGPAIVGGKYFVLGTRGEDEVVIALDAGTGKELWTA